MRKPRFRNIKNLPQVQQLVSGRAKLQPKLGQFLALWYINLLFLLSHIYLKPTEKKISHDLNVIWLIKNISFFLLTWLIRNAMSY